MGGLRSQSEPLAKISSVWHGKRLVASLLLTSALLGCSSILAISAAQAQQPVQATPSNAPISFSIPAQPLPSAINAFIRRTGWQISYSSVLASGKTSTVVSGTHTPAQALRQLVAGTGIEVRTGSPGSAALVDASISGNLGAATVDGAIALDTIDVSGGSGASETLPGNDPDAPYKSSSSIANISEQSIQRFRGTSPADFLKGEPGIMVGAARNSGAVDVNVRGMQGMDRVPVVIDGAQQSNTEYRGYAGVASRTYLDPDLIGGVTIEKGPSASADATGATGGIVRMRTLNADDILKPGAEVGVRIRGGFMGSTTEHSDTGTRGGIDASLLNRNYNPSALPDFGFTSGLDRPSLLKPTSGYGSIAAAMRTGSLEIVGAYARRNIGNYYAGTKGGDEGHVVLTPNPTGGTVRATLGGLTHFQAGEEVLNTYNDSTSYLLKGTAKLEGGHKLEIGFMRYESVYSEMFPSQVSFFGGPYQNSPSSVQVNTYTGTYSYNPSDNPLVDFKINVWKTDTTYDLTQSFPYYQFIGIFDPWIQESWSGKNSRRYGINVSNASRISGGWGQATFQYGFSFTKEDMTEHAGYSALGPIPEMSGLDRSGWREEKSAFVSAEWKPNDWLTFDSGLRYTATHSHDDCVSLQTGPCQKDLKNDGFAPILAARIEPWKGFQPYVRYAEAIRSPSLYESTKGLSFRISPDINLVPEHARNWEIGLNILRDNVFVPNDKARFKVAYFDNKIDDYLTRTYGVGGTGEGWAVMRNLDSARFEGIEVAASYDMGSIFSALSYTHYFNMSFCLKAEDAAALSATQCNPGGVGGGYAQMHVPPKDMLTLTLGTRLFSDALTVGSRISLVGKRPVDDLGPNAGTSGFTILTPWEPYALVDLFASYKFSDSIEAHLNIDNVGDVYYVDALSVGLMPAPGRTARAALTLKF